MPKVAEAEWLAELARLSRRNDEGLTVREWAAEVGRGEETTTKMLKRAKALGWLHVGKRTAEGLDGRTFQATVYRIVRPKKGR